MRYSPTGGALHASNKYKTLFQSPLYANPGGPRGSQFSNLQTTFRGEGAFVCGAFEVISAVYRYRRVEQILHYYEIRLVTHSVCIYTTNPDT